MIFRLLLGLAWAGGGLALAGCASQPVEIKPIGTVAVALNPAKKTGTITIRLANLVAFTLPPAEPNLKWEISFHDTRYLRQQTEFLPPQAEGEGATVSFLALATGSTRLRFVLVPVTAARSVKPVDQQEIRVTIR